MPNTFTQNFYYHVISKRQRANLVTPVIEGRLYPFIGGIVRDLNCPLLAIIGRFK